MNIAFAGFRHGHVFSALEWINEVEGTSIVAAWETHPASIELAEQRGIKITHSDYDEMLRNKDIDVVVMGDYYTARGEKTIAALRAGKSVFTDKPLCTSLAELDEIERLVEQNGLYLGCILDLRHTPTTAAAKKAIGQIGEIHNISFGGQHPLNYGSRPSWYFEKGKHGGTINDIAIHGIDLVRFLTGKGVSKVNAARCWNAYAKEEPDFRDSAQLMCELDGGTGLIADVSYSKPYPLNFRIPQEWRFTFWGENGVLEFNMSQPYAELTLKNAFEAQKIEAAAATSNPFIDFCSELNGSPQPLCTAEILKSTRDTLKLQAEATRNQ